MKILMVLEKFLDTGGIGQDIELKAQGLREMGHEVEFVLLNVYGKAPPTRNKLLKGPHPGSKKSIFSTTDNDVWLSCLKGWAGITVWSAGTEERMAEWQGYASSFDFVLWEVFVPGKPEWEKGNPDTECWWMGLYELDTVQVMSIHDCHSRDAYPHLAYVAHKFSGISCTNQAGYKALEWFNIPRAFIPPPHPVVDWEVLPTWDQRKKIAVSANTCKAWKRNEKGFEATSHMKSSKLIFAGDGINLRNLRSKDKCKSKWDGLWEEMNSNGNFKWMGVQSPEKVFEYYSKSRVMLDLSWSAKHEALGSHWNRSVFESGNAGAVSIVVTENMIEDGFQKRLHKVGYTHLEVSKNASPAEVAEIVDYACNMPAKEAEHYIHHMRRVFSKYCDYRVSSGEYIKLAEGKPAGLYPILEVGETHPAVLEAAEMKINDANPTSIRAHIRHAMGDSGEEEDDGA